MSSSAHSVIKSFEFGTSINGLLNSYQSIIIADLISQKHDTITPVSDDLICW